MDPDDWGWRPQKRPALSAHRYCPVWTFIIVPELNRFTTICGSCHKYNFCRDKSMLQNYVCRDNTFVATNIYRDKHVFIKEIKCIFIAIWFIVDWMGLAMFVIGSMSKYKMLCVLNCKSDFHL